MFGLLKRNKELKERSFITKIFEGEISYNKKQLLKILNGNKTTLDDVGYMKTTYFKERNILLQEEFGFLLDSCQVFYGQLAKANGYTSWNIISSWFQRYDKGNFHDTHIHFALEDHWNCVFYLDCNSGSSNMVLLEPGYPYANTNQRFAIEPKDGGCVAFPGHIPHFVEPNPSDNRLILSTNLEFIKGGKNV